MPPRFLLTPRRARCRARIAPLACFAAAATCDIIANESSSPLLPRPAPRHAAAQVNSLASKDLKRLFRYREDTLSDTHDQLKCTECKGLMAITADSAADANDMTPERQAACAELLEEVRQCETPARPFPTNTHTRGRHDEGLRRMCARPRPPERARLRQTSGLSVVSLVERPMRSFESRQPWHLFIGRKCLHPLGPPPLASTARRRHDGSSPSSMRQSHSASRSTSPRNASRRARTMPRFGSSFGEEKTVAGGADHITAPPRRLVGTSVHVGVP